ncbi:MAG: hypothetical protein QXR45_10195 [Candidatus Bathyarchaeia archaeon]
MAWVGGLTVKTSEEQRAYIGGDFAGSYYCDPRASLLLNSDKNRF